MITARRVPGPVTQLRTYVVKKTVAEVVALENIVLKMHHVVEQDMVMVMVCIIVIFALMVQNV